VGDLLAEYFQFLQFQKQCDAPPPPPDPPGKFLNIGAEQSFLDPPPPPPVDVIVEKIEDDPLPALPFEYGVLIPAAPPAPTVIGYAVAPQTENDAQVLKPPAPPPPPIFDPPPPPPATTAYRCNSSSRLRR
jgi:autotransporter family porin